MNYRDLLRKAMWVLPLAAGLTAGAFLHGPVHGRLAAGGEAAPPPAEIAPPQPSDMADLSLGERAQRIRRRPTATVAHRTMVKSYRLPARLVADPRRTWRITARVAGRLDRLFLSERGVAVTEGRPLALLYSPVMESAQHEYLIALDRKASDAPRTGGDGVAAARAKLRRYGLTRAQIGEIEKRGAPSSRVNLASPRAGTVLEIAVGEGDVVREGDVIASGADLSVLWAWVEFPEAFLPWLATGVTVEFKTPGGRGVAGAVAFVDPLVGSLGTVRVRVDLENPSGELRPGGDIMAQGVLALRRPWRDAPSLPVEAVLDTGSRTLAFLVDGKGRVTPVEIEAGPRGDASVAVLGGLAKGDRVLARARFALDSEGELPLPEESAPVFFVAQQHCPVMGGAVDRSQFVDFRGLRVYFCCPGCQEDFLSDPDRYLAKLRELGERPERIDGAREPSGRGGPK